MLLMLVVTLARAETVIVSMTSAPGSGLGVKARAAPAIPAGLAVGRHRCVVRIEVDPTGRTTDVQARRCDATIRAATTNAAWQWRFAPARDRGRPIAAETELRAVVRVRP